jgi:uncharacterized cupredoxin-like copper-binding protein
MSTHLPRRSLSWLGVLAAAGFALPGCATAEADHVSGPVRFPSQDSATATRTVRVGLIEWTITLSRRTVPAGRVFLQVTNAGATVHDLDVEGHLGEWGTPDLDPGDHARLAIRTRPGETLKLWCGEPGHAEAGMRAYLIVEGPQ